MFFALNEIIHLLLQYKYLVLFPIAVLEGPIVSVMAGFLVAQSFFNPFVTYAVLILGDLVGDTLYYSLGRWGGRPFVRKRGHLFGLKAERLELEEKRFYSHSKKVLFFGKTQSWGGLILFIAGTAKMPFLKFIWLNLIATLPKSFIFLIIGYFFGQAYVLIEKYIRYGGIAMTAVAIIVIIIYFILRKRRQPVTP